MKLNFIILAFIIGLLAITSCEIEEQNTEESNLQTDDVSELELEKSTMIFWDNLVSICGNAYSGKLITLPETDPDMAGKTMIMHVRQCSEDTIKIPFIIGDDFSRTWVITKEGNRLQLKHDHRHEDGSEDDLTQYGGMTTNAGYEHIQMFVADQITLDMVEYSAFNLWYMEHIPDEYFSYTLRRPTDDRIMSVKFDLSKTIDTPDAPWGWSE